MSTWRTNGCAVRPTRDGSAPARVTGDSKQRRRAPVARPNRASLERRSTKQPPTPRNVRMRTILTVALLLSACSDANPMPPIRDAGGYADAACVEGAISCRGPEVHVCSGGVEVIRESCGVEEACVAGIGCAMCQPGRPFCDGDQVRVCGADARSSEVMDVCEGTEICREGSCQDPCALARMRDGEAGCEFVTGGAGTLHVLNRNEAEVRATLLALDGSELEAVTVGGVEEATLALPGGALAHRLRTTLPVVAVQAGAENDASLLLPDARLGSRYRIASFGRSEVVLVPLEGDVTVRFTPNADASPDMRAGEEAELEVPASGLVVSGTGLAGSLAEAETPFAVLALGETSAPEGVEAPAPPSGAPESLTEARTMELASPSEAWGVAFVGTPSPSRDASWREPDVYLVVADEDETNVATSLPAPDDSFTLAAGEVRRFAATEAFSLEATAPVSVTQVLVSPEWLEAPELRGAAAAATLTPVAQMRPFYFHTGLPGYGAHHVVASVPAGATLLLDGEDTDELPVCGREPGPTAAGSSGRSSNARSPWACTCSTRGRPLAPRCTATPTTRRTRCPPAPGASLRPDRRTRRTSWFERNELASASGRTSSGSASAPGLPLRRPGSIASQMQPPGGLHQTPVSRVSPGGSVSRSSRSTPTVRPSLRLML